MRNKLSILTILLIFSIISFSQIIIREELKDDKYIPLENTKLLTIPMQTFDSIVLGCITIPEIPRSHECRPLKGMIYYGCRIEKGKQQNAKTLRGICPEIDSLISYQSDIVVKKLVSYLNIDTTKNYTIVVRFEYDGTYSNDSVFIADKKYSNHLSARSYVIAKKKYRLLSSSNGPPIHICIDTSQSISIPNNLEECFKSLDNLIDKKSKENITDESEDRFVISLNYTFGLFLRRYWKLENDSCILVNYFKGLGIQSPEDMTKIIFTSYYRYLQREDINLNRQVEELK